METAKGQRLGINLLLCATSITVFLGGSELLARLQYTPHKSSVQGMYAYDTKKGFQLTANYRGTFEGKAFATNSFGYRNPEITVEKPLNTKRILVLGDSISFGHGVEDDESYPRLLETALSTSLQETNVQVINTAAPMNFPLQEYYDLERSLKLDPDVIVLQLTLNDIIDAPIINAIPLSDNVDYVLKQYSALYLMLKDLHSRVRFRDLTGENIADKAKQFEYVSLELLIYDPNHPDVVMAWDETLGLLEKITSLAKKEEIPLVILVTPFIFQLTTDVQFSSPQERLRMFATEKNIPFVDLLDALKLVFAEVVNPELTREQISEEVVLHSLNTYHQERDVFWNALFMDYDHPTAQGHELISSVLHPLLVDVLGLR